MANSPAYFIIIIDFQRGTGALPPPIVEKICLNILKTKRNRCMANSSADCAFFKIIIERRVYMYLFHIIVFEK